MTGALAEAKASLGHQRALIDQHMADCERCKVKRRGGRCAGKSALLAEARRMRKEIGEWFAPQPGRRRAVRSRRAVNRRRLATVGRAWRAAYPGWSLWLSDGGQLWATGPGYTAGLMATLTGDRPGGISAAISQWTGEVAAAAAWHARHGSEAPAFSLAKSDNASKPGSMLQSAGNNALAR